MPFMSALIMIGAGTIGFMLRSRYFTNSSTPPLYIISSRFSTAWRMSDSTILTPEFRNASSRRRCSSVAKSYSTLVKVPVEARNVTSVPRLPLASPTTMSGATASPWANSMKCSLPSRQTRSCSFLGRGKDRHLGAALAVGLADHLERCHRVAMGEFDEMFLAVAPDPQLQLAR